MRALAKPVTRVLVVLVIFAGSLLGGSSSPGPTADSLSMVSVALAFTGDGDAWQSDEIVAQGDVVGLTWDGDGPRRAWVRQSQAGVWSEWFELGIDIDHGPDPASDEGLRSTPGSEFLFIGAVDTIQFRVQGQAAGLSASMVRGEGRSSVSTRLADLVPAPIPAEGSPAQPTIIPRSAWNADSCEPPDRPQVRMASMGVRTSFVHHTASSNTYTEDAVPSMIQAICAYHVFSRGWDDIGYNFLIDRFGNIYEGRKGGVDLPVQGAHTGGFNSYSVGVGIIGDHRYVEPSAGAQAALVDLLAWKLDLEHVDPKWETTVVSLGSTLYPEGESVNLLGLNGHRDVSATSCPGDLCYGQLGSYRTAVRDAGGPKIFGGWPSGLWTDSEVPVTFDFYFSESMDWNLEVLDPDGQVTWGISGSGTSNEVTWSPDGGDEPGDYRLRIRAATFGGVAARSVDSLVRRYLPPFADDEGLSHEPNINLVADAGYTQGCADIRPWYCPDDEVSRAQMASFLTRALGLPITANDYFDDDEGTAHEAAINSLAEAGITQGCGTTRMFCPNRNVTRAQLASFLARALDLPAGPSVFEDVDGIHAEAISSLAAAGITSGCNADGTRYCPELTVLRGQMASFLARAFLGAGS